MGKASLELNGSTVRPGQRTTVELPFARLYTHTPLSMPVHLVNGKHDGPRLFVSAAIHGDELNGVEIIRRLLRRLSPGKLHGSVIAVPIVNVYGFINQSRYLPDRRDLNRSFPGSAKGSLAARLANLFMTQLVGQCSHGIDLHTGAMHRSNLPQIRAGIDDDKTAAMARAFGAPVILNADMRDGSLRQAAAERGITMVVYEAGEALRYDEIAIRAGVRGILRVMRYLKMLEPSSRTQKAHTEPVVANSSTWVRAPMSGILRTVVPLGNRVDEDGLLAVIADPFGDREVEVRSSCKGIVIGKTNLPLANEGDALFHVARFEKVGKVAAQVEEFRDSYQPDPPAAPDPEAPIV